MGSRKQHLWRLLRAHLKSVGLLIYLLFCLLAFYLNHNPWGTYYVPREKVWSEVQDIAKDKDLDPNLVYAIVWAESSLNAHAHTHVARGIMQITHDAWDRVGIATWREAYDWKINLEAGCSYLVLLKKELTIALKKKPTNAQLAGAYRYGFTGLKKCGFDVGKLPKTNNKIYQKIFSGDSLPVATPSHQLSI